MSLRTASLNGVPTNKVKKEDGSPLMTKVTSLRAWDFMNNILEDLYRGNIRPDLTHYAQDSAYVKAAHLKSEAADKLLDLLDESGAQLLDQYSDAQSDMDDIVRLEKFSYGVKLGVLLMAEVFMGEHPPL